jgi:hypothetical protein
MLCEGVPDDAAYGARLRAQYAEMAERSGLGLDELKTLLLLSNVSLHALIAIGVPHREYDRRRADYDYLTSQDQRLRAMVSRFQYSGIEAEVRELAKKIPAIDDELMRRQDTRRFFLQRPRREEP